MKKIPLTQGKEALVDDQDYDWLMQWKWLAAEAGGKHVKLWYARRSGPRPDRKWIRMHVEIAMRAGLPISRYYDHRDGDGLNNQRENLRACTQSQNIANSRKRNVASSTFKGVYWHRQRKKWCAQICAAGKRFWLGYFCIERQAHDAYMEAARKHFGQFVWTNPP